MNKRVETLPNGFVAVIDETSDNRNIRMFKVASEKRIKIEKAKLERKRQRKIAKAKARAEKELAKGQKE